MKPQRLLLIVNPISGTKPKDKILPEIESVFSGQGYEVDTAMTSCRGDGYRLASQAVETGYNAVVAVGGDGTVNEVASAMCDTDVAMGIIPCGSGNGLARHIGLPSDPIESAKVVCPDNVHDCDYCTANGNKFFCTFGTGFDAAVTKHYSEQGQRGLSTYLKSAVHEFSRYTPRRYRITVGDNTIEQTAFLVACCNASQYGNNAYIAPDASIRDGLIDVVIFKEASHIETLLAGVDMLTGMLSYNRMVDIIRAPSLRIECEETCAAHVDGEPIEIDRDISVNCHHKALKLFIDPSWRKVTPVLTPLSYIGRDLGIAITKTFKNLTE